MQTYYWLLALTLVFSFLAQRYEVIAEKPDGEIVKEHSGFSNLFFAVLCLILVCVAGLRFYVGTDYGAYYNGFRQFAYNTWTDLIRLDEPGYDLLALIAVWIGDDGAIAIFLASAITITVSLIVIYRNTDKLVYAILLYLFVGCWSASFNAVRQCLACAFIFLGYRSLKNRQFWGYVLCVVVAFLFHRSAILMVFYYIFAHRKISLGNIVIMIIGAIVVSYADTIVRAMTENVLEHDLTGTGTYLTTTVNTVRVIIGIAPACFFLVSLNHHPKSEEDRFHMNFLLFHAALSVATANSAYYARYTIYTAPFLAIAIPELSKKFSKKNRGIITFFILVLYLGFWLYELNHSDALNNFRWIWER